MTMTQDLRTYLDTAAQDKPSWLGVLLIYSVVDHKVRWDELSRKMQECGLQAHIPPEPSDENVFRKVFKDGVRKTIGAPTPDEPDAEQRVMMRLVARDNGVFTKRVVIEHVNPGGKTLSYEETIEVVFDKNDPTNVGVVGVGAWHDEAWDLVNSLRDEYDRQRGTVDGQGIRVVIRDVLESCRSTSLRPGGGAYFIPQLYLPRAEALEAVADVIPGTLVHTLPIIDNGKQRSQLKKAFEFESSAELEALIEEMRDAAQKGTSISPQTSAKFARAAKKARSKLAEYQSLLNDNLDVVDAKLTLADMLQMQLLTQVDTGE